MQIGGTPTVPGGHVVERHMPLLYAVPCGQQLGGVPIGLSGGQVCCGISGRAALALLELGPGRAAIGRRADWAVGRASLRRRLDRAAFALLELGAGRAAIGRRADRPISRTGLRRRHDGAALALLELGSGRAAIGRRADRAISRTRVLACFGLVRAAGSPGNLDRCPSSRQGIAAPSRSSGRPNSCRQGKRSGLPWSAPCRRCRRARD